MRMSMSKTATTATTAVEPGTGSSAAPITASKKRTTSHRSSSTSSSSSSSSLLASPFQTRHQHHHQQEQLHSPLLHTKKRKQQQQQQLSNYSWLNKPCIENGYIFHPKAGWIIHPSYYNDDEPLCNPKHPCHHKRDCKEVRMRMAVYQYIRAEQTNTALSYREVELLWGVSHSTVQRRKLSMQSQSDVFFLMTPFKHKVQQHQQNTSNKSNIPDNIPNNNNDCNNGNTKFVPQWYSRNFFIPIHSTSYRQNLEKANLKQ